MDTLYGDGMSDFELGNFHANPFTKYTLKGNSITSLDDVNENENMWMKKCLLLPTFQINVDGSKI